MDGRQFLREELVKGWQTWCNESVLAHVHMPEAMGIRLGLKDYEYGKMITGALIGEKADRAEVFPKAHAYDGCYTALSLSWLGNEITVETAVSGGDLVVLVTPHTRKKKDTALIIAGMSLWNSGAVVRGGEGPEDGLLLQKGSAVIPVFAVGELITEPFAECETPYIAAALAGPAGISTGCRRTLSGIRDLIAQGKRKWEKNKEKYGELAEVYSAMQTCQAWDTVYNPETGLPMTTVSRLWNRNWGGYVLFCWDTFFAAVMQSVDFPELAVCNALGILDTLTPEGFVPNFACQGAFRSYDRSQPPVGADSVLTIYDRYPQEWFLKEAYPKLKRWNDWFYAHRRTRNGLLAWGSDSYEGRTGHRLENEDVHNRQGAAYESGLDDSPMYDDIPFDEERNILLLEDVGLTGLYIHDCRCLNRIAQLLGRQEDARLLCARAADMEDRLEQLWDEETGLYLNRREDTGAFQQRITPFHFHALFSSRVGKERAQRIIREHFLNPEEFCGEYMLPSIARNDPAYPEQVYWRGRIWPPMNYLAYKALSAYGLEQACHMLAEKSAKLLLKEWLEKGHVHENYDSETGEGCNVARSDRFYHWGGLLGYIALADAGLLSAGFPEKAALPLPEQ